MENIGQEFTGSLGAIITIVALMLQQVWHSYRNNRLDKANNSAHVDLVNRLSQQLDKEREATKVANDRADKFAQERNDLHLVVGELKGEIRAMRGQIDTLTAEVAELKGGGNVQIHPA